MIHAIDPDLARRNFRVIDQVVHSVKATQQSRLSAAGRPDERRDLFFRDLEIDAV